MKAQQQSNKEQKKYFGVSAPLFDFFSLHFDKRFIKIELKGLRYKFFVQVQKSLYQHYAVSIEINANMEFPSLI